jgi:hypothetical protein
MRCRSTKRPIGAYRRERLAATASLARRRGSEGLPASEFLRTGLPPQLPIVSEKEAEVRVSDVVRAQDQAGGGDGGPCVAHARAPVLTARSTVSCW